MQEVCDWVSASGNSRRASAGGGAPGNQLGGGEELRHLDQAAVEECRVAHLGDLAVFRIVKLVDEMLTCGVAHKNR